MDDPRRTVEEAIAGFAPGRPVVLAVSGGRDSMVLLHAMARLRPDLVAAVATFDHGTGAAATRAAALVAREAKTLGLPVRRGRARGVARTEDAWRSARWQFLGALARELDARVATAHTRDDQIETVIMRVMRGSAARGLAGLFAQGPVLRPLVDVDGGVIAGYAQRQDVRWIDDPSNESRAHLRNRVRLDLRPALERAHPGFASEMLALSRRAAALREQVERLAFTMAAVDANAQAVQVARATLTDYDAKGLALLWPAIAAGIGVALDRRGAERLAGFTHSGRAGSRIQLSGGYEAVIHREMMVVRRSERAAPSRATRLRGGGATMGGWRFRAADGAPDSLWNAELPGGVPLVVRPWRPGDRMTPMGADAPRRVKGLLRDAGVDAARRAGWPVVLAGEEIVWIPGVRRSSAATARSGRPVVRYLCEPLDDR
jgi:tRNA(Ile)-lysidine synthase